MAGPLPPFPVGWTTVEPLSPFTQSLYREKEERTKEKEPKKKKKEVAKEKEKEMRMRC